MIDLITDFTPNADFVYLSRKAYNALKQKITLVETQLAAGGGGGAITPEVVLETEFFDLLHDNITDAFGQPIL